MNILFLNNGLRMCRDRGDPPIRKESTIVHHLLRALNAEFGYGRRVRFYPNRHGLTDSRLGVRDTRTGTIYWHAAYETEDAVKAFNAGDVYFQKA